MGRRTSLARGILYMKRLCILAANDAVFLPQEASRTVFGHGVDHALRPVFVIGAHNNHVRKKREICFSALNVRFWPIATVLDRQQSARGGHLHRQLSWSLPDFFDCSVGAAGALRPLAGALSSQLRTLRPGLCRFQTAAPAPTAGLVDGGCAHARRRFC